jgi:CheY-like chemotaxis protein
VARILIAGSTEGGESLERILKGHNCTVVLSLSAAQTQLKTQAFDLIAATLHFDDSQMFEFIREVKKSGKNVDKPIICFCSRNTPMSRLMHESLESTTSILGAWMYLDEHAYNVYQDPDAELRRVIERCLTEESRKEIHEKRLDIQEQRIEIQNLRKLLRGQEWSPEMKDYLIGLKNDLEMLLQEVTRLHLAADANRASVLASRDLKDRVAERVTNNENRMASIEEIQAGAESGQSAAEQQLAQQEDEKETDARRKQRSKDR